MKINRRVGINAFLIDVQYLRVSMLRLEEGEPGALYVADGFAGTPKGLWVNHRRRKAPDRMLHRHSKVSELK